MKKLFAVTLTLALLLSMAAPALAIEIGFWNGFTGSDGEVLTEIVNQFNETNDKGIKINMDIIPWANFHEKLPPALATGTAPELVLMGNDVLTTYVATDSLLPINDWFDVTGVGRDQFPEAVLDLFSLDGNQYMIPMQVNSLYLYWNKTLFREAGLDPEQPPKTWTELFEMSRKLANADQNVAGFALPVQSTSVYSNLIYANGGALVDYENNTSVINSDIAIEAFTEIQKATQDKVSPMSTTGPDFDNLLFAGQVAMYINGPWCINGCNTHGLDYGISKLPAGTAGYKNDLGGCGYAVTSAASDEAKAAAYEFMKFWNSTEICKKWSVVNGFPPYLKSVQEDPEVAANALLTEMSDALQYGEVYLKGVPNVQLINNDVLFPALENIMNGADVKTELDNAKAAMDMLLAG